MFSQLDLCFSNSLIIHKAKTKENHRHGGFGNMIKHLHKFAKLSPSFSPEVHICFRGCIKHSCECLIHYFMLCSRDLDALCVQRIMGFFIVITHKSRRSEHPIT